MQKTIYIQRCHKDAYIPKYANMHDAGADLALCEDLTIMPGETVLAPLGIKIAIPTGYELQIRPRSGLSAKTGLRIPNSPGTIDSNYRDELKIILENTGNQKLIFKKGDRIAQAILNKIPQANYVEIDDIKKIKGDRGGGLGSSGLN